MDQAGLPQHQGEGRAAGVGRNRHSIWQAGGEVGPLDQAKKRPACRAQLEKGEQSPPSCRVQAVSTVTLVPIPASGMTASRGHDLPRSHGIIRGQCHPQLAGAHS